MIRAEDEVVDHCSQLIAMDSSNGIRSEAAAADYVATKLREVGLKVVIVEPQPGRKNVLVRIPGKGSDVCNETLLVHSHLDVVPALEAEWTVPPFSGAVRDGCVWGRGAIDMKDGVAVSLALAREFASGPTWTGRSVMFAFFADEEAGGGLGARWLTVHRPELFRGVTDAIGEGGGFSCQLGNGTRIYPIQCAERGQAWLRLTARGRSSHGSSPNRSNSVTALSETLSNIGNFTFPLQAVATVESLISSASGFAGTPADFESLSRACASIDPAVEELVSPIMRNSANPTMVHGGAQINVIPDYCNGYVDGRFLPGLEAEFLETIDSLLGDNVSREFVHHDIAYEEPFEGAVVNAIREAVASSDGDGQVVPYCNPGGTDGKHLHKLGIRCYGFKGLRLSPEFPYHSLFHGVDERVPLDGLVEAVSMMRGVLQRA